MTLQPTPGEFDRQPAREHAAGAAMIVAIVAIVALVVAVRRLAARAEIEASDRLLREDIERCSAQARDREG